MTYHRIDNGPEGRPNSPVESLPLQWPVLARLPWVDDAVEPMGAQASAAAPYAMPLGPPPVEESRPALRLAAAPAPTAPPPSTVFAPPTRDFAAAGNMPAAPQPKRHYRIDPGDGRIVAAAIGSMHSTHPPQRPHSFAARLFHWHAALAPHAGVALTFFLALTAGLLYWRTLGPAAPAPLQPAASPLAWANEYAPPTAAESPAPVNQWQAPTPTYTPPEMSWPLAPRVTLDAAPLSAAMAEPPTLDSVESLARDLSAEAGDDSPAVHQPAVDGDITPTPASPAPATSTLAYPSTPFALIDPSAIRPEDIAEIAAEQQAPAPAEGSTEDASLPGSPR